MVPDPILEEWLRAHEGWARSDDGIAKTYAFVDFAAALAFTVRLGLLAEKRGHHPDITVGWGKARVFWTTHDARGTTVLDLELGDATDAIAAEFRATST